MSLSNNQIRLSLSKMDFEQSKTLDEQNNSYLLYHNLTRKLTAAKEFDTAELEKLYRFCDFNPKTPVDIGTGFGACCLMTAQLGGGAFLFELLNRGIQFTPRMWEHLIHNSLTCSERSGIPMLFLSYIKLHNIKINPNFEHDGQTLLMKAAGIGHDLIVKYLLDIGANPNYTTTIGSYALNACIHSKLASEDQKLEVIKVLIAGGVDIALSNHNYANILIQIAIYKNDKEYVKIFSYLLAQVADTNILYQRYGSKNTLLSTLSCFGKYEMLNALIQKAGNDLVKEQGANAIFFAMTQLKTCTAISSAILLHHGVNIYARNNEGETLLDAAIRLNHEPLVQVLKQFKVPVTKCIRIPFRRSLKSIPKNNKKRDKILIAIVQGNFNVVFHYLMKYKNRIDNLDYYLYQAIRNLNSDISQLLIVAGANVEYYLHSYHSEQPKVNKHTFERRPNGLALATTQTASKPLTYHAAPFREEDKFRNLWRLLDDAGINLTKQPRKTNGYASLFIPSLKDQILNILKKAMFDHDYFLFKRLKAVAATRGTLDITMLQRLYHVARDNKLTHFKNLLEPGIDLASKVLKAKLHFKAFKHRNERDWNKWLDFQFAQRPKLLAAIANADADKILDCIANGADPNFGGHCWPPNTREYVHFKGGSQNIDSVTPLHMATLQPQAERLTALMLDLGARVDLTNLHTDLHWKKPLRKLMFMNPYSQTEGTDVEQVKTLLIDAEVQAQALDRDKKYQSESERLKRDNKGQAEAGLIATNLCP